MASLHIQPHNYQTASNARGRVLLHVPTTSIFELDAVSGALLDLFEAGQPIRGADIEQRFNGVYSPGEICDSLSDLLALGIVADGHKLYEIEPRAVKGGAINTLVITLTTGCNLSCSYCYREDLTTPRRASVMDPETGRRAIDLLFSEAGEAAQVSVTFFGGEPLTCFPLMRELTAYALQQGEHSGKVVRFSVTTNATLLSDEIIDFFNSHRFGISVSMDGNEAQHDKHRVTIGGKGSYRSVVSRVGRLLARYDALPVAARVTLGRGNTDVESIYRHLHDEIGFVEVGFAPVTASPTSPIGLTPDEMEQVFAAMQSLGKTYTALAKRGERHGFANMNQMLFDLWNGTRKTLPCGAGVGLLAVGASGKLSLCHRFTGGPTGHYGDLDQGIARPQLEQFLNEAQRGHIDCASCPARSICAGGCYHEAWQRNGDPLSPTFDHCDHIRSWLAFGLACYGEIMLANPDFFRSPKSTRSLLQ
jgi:uncharacterized protein